MKFLKDFPYIAAGGVSLAALGSVLIFLGGWGTRGPSGFISYVGGLLTIMPFFWAAEMVPPFFYIMDSLSKLPSPYGPSLIYFVLPATAWIIVLSILYPVYCLIRKKIENRRNKTAVTNE